METSPRKKYPLRWHRMLVLLISFIKQPLLVSEICSVSSLRVLIGKGKFSDQTNIAGGAGAGRRESYLAIWKTKFQWPWKESEVQNSRPGCSLQHIPR